MQGDSMVDSVDGKTLITIVQPRSSLMLGSSQKSFYVPNKANVHYLRTFISGKYGNSKDSVFLFAYGYILNNHESIQQLCHKFKNKINQQKGLEIQIAAMASF